MHRSAQGSSLEASAEQDGHSRSGGETIAAISTPAGEGAIALVRISGAAAIDVAEQIFRGKEMPSQFLPRVQHFGEIVDAGRLIDQVMISIHRAPASYTGEDVVEISCHGGMLVTARVLEMCLRAGARAARPGEFTERAFLSGRMDLPQAEAVIDVIRAKTDLALRSATEQLEGRLSQQIGQLRRELIELVAHIEASIDFSQEGITPDEGAKLVARVDSISKGLAVLLATADQGRILREGVRAVIYGATNAGKSSLLNRLLGYDRVIVSETHGTTRDAIEEVISLRGVPIRLLDTAGLRTASDEVEREGMARTTKSLQAADLRLHVADSNASKPMDFETVGGNGAEIIVLNKCDLPQHRDWHRVDALRISCVTGSGLAELENRILERITQGNLCPENMVAINARHKVCLGRALEACNRARIATQNEVAPEYVVVDLNEALRAIGEVIGTVEVEEILDSVFSQFCIGK